MAFVLDASLTMTWCFADESNDYTRAVYALLQRTTAVVPAVWSLEVANAILIGERRQRLAATDAARFSGVLLTLPVEVDDVDWAVLLNPIMALARQENLSAYDASYLELALRRGLPLATQDTRLRDAAGRIGVALVTAQP